MKGTKFNFKKPNGHITNHELKRLYDWLLTPENERKEAVLNWTSGLARYFGYIIEKFYSQKNSEDLKSYPKYEETFSNDPFMKSLIDTD